MVVPPVPVTTPFVAEASTSGISTPWLNWFQQLRRKLNITPGPLADDVAAKAAGVEVGQQYYTAAGAVQVRLK